jgi:hypothetical protein
VVDFGKYQWRKDDKSRLFEDLKGAVAVR